MARAALIPLLLIPVLTRVAHRFRVLDMPDDRKSHAQPVPRIGGIAIFFSVYVLTLQYWRFDAKLLGICLAASIIFVIGIADDIRGLSATVKLIGQLIAAGIVIGFGVTITFIPSTWFGAPVLEALITLVWIIGVMNAINFLDGIDGLVASLGIVCGFFFFLLASLTFQRYVAYISVILCAGCLGFLPYNFKFWKSNEQGSIFLGDSGSTLIGFFLATIAVMGSWAMNNPMVALSTPLLILGVAIFDMIYITCSRIRGGRVRTVKEWIDYVGKDHFHHRLMTLGLSKRGAVFFIMLLTIILGMSALVIPHLGQVGAILLLVQALFIFITIVILMLAGREIVNTEGHHASQ